MSFLCDCCNVQCPGHIFRDVQAQELEAVAFRDIVGSTCCTVTSDSLIPRRDEAGSQVLLPHLSLTSNLTITSSGVATIANREQNHRDRNDLKIVRAQAS